MEKSRERYNLTVEEGKENPCNVNIPKLEGQHKVASIEVEMLNIAQPVKTQQVNIGSEVEPKFKNIGEYWDNFTVRKVTELLHEYQDMFPTNFSDIKGIVGDF